MHPSLDLLISFAGTEKARERRGTAGNVGVIEWIVQCNISLSQLWYDKQHTRHFVHLPAERMTPCARVYWTRCGILLLSLSLALVNPSQCDRFTEEFYLGKLFFLVLLVLNYSLESPMSSLLVHVRSSSSSSSSSSYSFACFIQRSVSSSFSSKLYYFCCTLLMFKWRIFSCPSVCLLQLVLFLQIQLSSWRSRLVFLNSEHGRELSHAERIDW